MRAFEVSALDYLLKPLDDERFEVTMSRVRKQMAAASRTELVDHLLRFLNQSSFIDRPGNWHASLNWIFDLFFLG